MIWDNVLAYHDGIVLLYYKDGYLYYWLEAYDENYDEYYMKVKCEKDSKLYNELVNSDDLTIDLITNASNLGAEILAEYDHTIVLFYRNGYLYYLCDEQKGSNGITEKYFKIKCSKDSEVYKQIVNNGLVLELINNFYDNVYKGE